MVSEQSGPTVELEITLYRLLLPIQRRQSRVDRWFARFAKKGQPVTAETFQDSIDFPSTYVMCERSSRVTVFYKRRGPLLTGEPGSSSSVRLLLGSAGALNIGEAIIRKRPGRGFIYPAGIVDVRPRGWDCDIRLRRSTGWTRSRLPHRRDREWDKVEYGGMEVWADAFWRMR
jgi:hypothetical protein